MADEKLKELEHEFDNIKWDIVGLGEVRRKDERKIQLNSGNILFWKGSTNKNEAGVGFLINEKYCWKCDQLQSNFRKTH